VGKHKVNFQSFLIYCTIFDYKLRLFSHSRLKKKRHLKEAGILILSCILCCGEYNCVIPSKIQHTSYNFVILQVMLYEMIDTFLFFIIIGC